MRARSVILAVGTFAIGIDAFVTVSLVGPVARGLRASGSAAGRLVTLCSRTAEPYLQGSESHV